MFTIFILGLISSIYMFAMIDILNEEGIPTHSFEFIFSWRKFTNFIESNECDEFSKKKYTKIYKIAVWTRRAASILFFTLFFFVLILMIVSVRS